MTGTFPALTFTVCGHTYAISIVDVVEVAAMVETATIADDTDPILHGVVIRRGEPMMLLDLRHLFYCADAPVTLETLFVVVQSNSDKEPVGFLVDQVQGVVYLKQDDVRPVEGGRGYIRGIVAHQQVLIQWLDVNAITAHALPGSLEM